MDKKERAMKGALERWNPTVPRAKHTGVLNIAGEEIQCDVLADGRRIIRQKTLLKAMGKGQLGSYDKKRGDELNLPIFLTATNLIPYLGKDFAKRGEIINYRGLKSEKLRGYDASILPEACKIYVKAADDGVLQKSQMPIALVCRTILYALATVGITALIDECTGYQEIRERNELNRILNSYISDELRVWTEKFPNEFFKQVYRIHGWEYPKIGNHPQCVANFINKNIYERLPEGVLEELKKVNPITELGNRKYRHHQFLTPDIGDDNLKKQIVQVITVMKLSENKEQFKELMEKL